MRRNLDLYGKATDSQFGLQHNHMQFQPVIDVAPDGQSAKMRSRALSIMGQWQRYSQWMGGVYENDYVKENGVWKIKHDQVFNTYFVPYTVGWKTVQPRPPPGISKDNPPDAAADAPVRDVPVAVPAAVPLRQPGHGRDGRLDAAGTVSGAGSIVLDIFRALGGSPAEFDFHSFAFTYGWRSSMTDNNTDIDRRAFVAGRSAPPPAWAHCSRAARRRSRRRRVASSARRRAPRFRPRCAGRRRSTSSRPTSATARSRARFRADLNGAFYRVGPDPQYPLHPRDIPFDGEGHVSMFRIKNGRVDYKSRMVRNERWLANDKAGKQLFPIYRNPSMDDPSAKGLSRSTANTHIINHKELPAVAEGRQPARARWTC